MLERWFAKYEFSAPYQLCNSDCEAVAQKTLLELADDEVAALWRDLSLAYTQTKGHPVLLNAIAEHYESDLIRSDSIQTFAPEEGIYAAMRCLVRPNDTVVCTFPGYQSLYEIAKAIGAKCVPWTVREEDGRFRFDPSDLEAIVEEVDPKLIVVNFPHNPTGALPTQEEWERIARIADRTGATLFSDEMYRYLEYDEADRLPSACEISPNAVTLAGLSKSWGCPGLRIGWLASQCAEFLDETAAYRDYLSICSAAPAEILGIVALRETERLCGLNRQRVLAHLSIAETRISAMSDVEWRSPQAGPIAFPKLAAGTGAEAYATTWVREKGLLLLPSTMYEYGDAHFRVGLGRADFSDVFEIWAGGLGAGS